MADKKTIQNNIEDAYAELAAKKLRLRKTYTIWCAVSGGIALLGLIIFMGFEANWGLLLLPVIAAALTVLLWCLLARFVLVEDAERLLDKKFALSLKLALALPIGLALLFALMALPVSTEVLASNLATGLGYLLAAALMTIIPMAGFTCAIISIVLSISHWRETPANETHIYREGPFALSLILFIAEIALCIMVFVFALS